MEPNLNSPLLLRSLHIGAEPGMPSCRRYTRAPAAQQRDRLGRLVMADSASLMPYVRLVAPAVAAAAAPADHHPHQS